MTGLPAARQTDMTKHGGPITQGSLTVHIGSSGGVACSTCPEGQSVGNPVNPLLGAKVQSGEIDLALPGPMPFVLARDYSSYQTDTPAPVGLLGPGWWLPTEVTLLQTADKLEQPDGSTTQSRFDASGRVTASIDALGRETHYELDVATGRLLGITSPDGSQTRWNYNAHGQIVHIVNPGGSSEHIEYDTKGRLTASIDALGHATRYHYAEPQSEVPNAIEDARRGQKHLTWNAAGLLTSYTDCSGSTTRYRYNRWGQRTETTGEEDARSSSRYDDQGLLLAHTNALGQTTTYAYNAGADLIRVTAADGISVEFERDAQGQLLTYQYGNPAQPLIQRFQYDAAGRLTQLTNENGAHTTFAYDLMDRLVNQVNFDGRAQGWHYNGAGEITQSHDENLISRHQYDKIGRLLQRQTFQQEQPQDIQHEHFSYSEAGPLAKAWHTTELGGNTITVEFIRDPIGRSIEEIQTIKGPQGQEVWRYTVERAFNELGTESQTHYAGLPAINWQTYGPGHHWLAPAGARCRAGRMGSLCPHEVDRSLLLLDAVDDLEPDCGMDARRHVARPAVAAGAGNAGRNRDRLSDRLDCWCDLRHCAGP